MPRAPRLETVVLGAALLALVAAGSQAAPPPHRVLSEAEYRDKVHACWLGQMIAVMMGLDFEARPASVEWVDRFSREWPHAPVDDDWYYEMKALEAFEQHGPGLTVRQLGRKWLEDGVGFAGSSGQARAALRRGVPAPDSGHPRHNRLWFSMGNQCRGDLFGLLAPGLPNVAARLSRELGHVNSYAEGTEGGVLLSTMVSLAFVRRDARAILEEAVQVLDSRSPQRLCVEEVIARARRGEQPEAISDAITRRWRGEYPVFNNAVLNGGLSALAIWFGEGDFLKTVNAAYAAGDFSDADCNAAVAGSVAATLCGTRGLPPQLVAEVRDRVKGDKYNQHPLSAPVDETVTRLAERTVAMARRVMAAAGVVATGDEIRLPVEAVAAQPAEPFQAADLTRYWNPDWELRQAALTSVHGGTYLESDEVLATFPRDESLGALLRRRVALGARPALTVSVAADPGRQWQLEVYAGNERVLQRTVDGGPAPATGAASERRWERIDVDLTKHAGRATTLRLYQRVDRSASPGTAYWKELRLDDAR